MPNGRSIRIYIDNECGGYNMSSIDWISFMANLSSGLILAIVRSFEPYFLKITKWIFYWMFGEVREEEDNSN